ncbi:MULTISPECIES: DUF5676 family membrane protein [unclassified Novosphingobium]|jgi:hypothetical protein|uniref:DUF5676 family membrane protein n=1 Tax=unclassified Novosphingobium TaxID=2644732 RepID=UPI000931BABE|nr:MULTISPECIES: DUF5676 family membrane protein [unclassified Novosphingobium]RQW38191.1 hypothetical protein EH199_23150 [Novosphingobium sp. LASN5T]
MPHDRQQPALIPVVTSGLALSLFFSVSYILCILGYLFLPGLPVQHSALAIFLPGFQLLSWKTFLLGLGEAFGWGWYIALVFGPLYNFLVSRSA